MAKAKQVASKRVFVTVDMSFEEVLRLQEEGSTIFFVDEPTKFLSLSEEEVGQLNSDNRIRYQQASVLAAERSQGSEDEEFTAGLSIPIEQADASDRLAVRNQDARFSYGWKRAVNIEKYRGRGWELVDGQSSEKSFNMRERGGKTFHTVQTGGMDELVLMRKPKSLVRKHKAEMHDRFRDRTRVMREEREEAFRDAKLRRLTDVDEAQTEEV